MRRDLELCRLWLALAIGIASVQKRRVVRPEAFIVLASLVAPLCVGAVAVVAVLVGSGIESGLGSALGGTPMVIVVGAVTSLVLGAPIGLASALIILALQRRGRLLSPPEAVAIGAAVCAAVTWILGSIFTQSIFGWQGPLSAALFGAVLSAGVGAYAIRRGIVGPPET